MRRFWTTEVRSASLGKNSSFGVASVSLSLGVLDESIEEEKKRGRQERIGWDGRAGVMDGISVEAADGRSAASIRYPQQGAAAVLIELVGEMKMD